MAKQSKFRDEDLFKSSTMTFGEHLEELRSCLVKAVFGLLLAFILTLAIGWPTDSVNWATAVVKFIQTPLVAALERFYLNHSRKDLDERFEKFQGLGFDTPDKDTFANAILLDRMMPVFYWMDERQTVQALSKQGTVPIAAGNLSRFGRVDVLDAAGFCKAVYHAGEDDLGTWIWSKLPEDGRKLVTRCATAEGQPTGQDKENLAKAIQQHVLTDGLYEENQAFFNALANPGFFATKETEDRAQRLTRLLTSKEQLEPAEFQRRLLGSVYPESIAAGPRYGSMLPVVLWRPVTDDPRMNPKSLNAQEMFMVFIKAALLVSLVIASPWIFWQIWSFVAAGLYPKEKKYVYLYLPFSLVLFLAGVSLCFFFVFRYVLDFLFWFNDMMEVDPDMRISEWFGFALFLPLGFGVAFQLPLVMLFLERIGVMTVQSYLAKWRMAVLVIFFISMILTPADPYSMVLMAVPLTLLYFGGIALCRFMPKGRNPFRQPIDEPA